jgi:hypothetical protein
MPYPQELEYWIEELSTVFPNLNASQKQVLALYSYGMAMTQRCGQTIVLVFLALLLKLKPANLRQRLKEFTYEAEVKRGAKRRELEVESAFAPFLSWVLQQWQERKKVVLAVDVTYLKARHTILCISLLYGQSAVPVAWKVLHGNSAGEWHPLWAELLAQLSPALPRDKQVLLLFDRGLYSKRLFDLLRGYGWHPFMRIREQGLYKRCNGKHWHDLKSLAYQGMKAYHFKAECFKGDPLLAYLWVEWDTEQEEACLLLSDLAPARVMGNPYPLRMWIEASFKDWKRGGFRLEQCKTPDPQRLARLIFVLALALFYLMRLGNGLLSTQKASLSDPIHRLSLLTLGWINLLVSSIHDRPLREAPFRPYELPPFYSSQNTYP